MEIIKESIFSVHEGRWQTRKMFFYLEQPIDQNKGKIQNQHRTKREENLHKLAHVILPTDAFKLQISAQKSTL